MIENPKITIVGAGSIFFTRAVVIGMCQDDHYRGGVLALIDTDAEMLDVMHRLCLRIVDEMEADLEIQVSTDRCDVLPGSDFVVLSFSMKGVDLREVDTQIPAKYGVIQASGDTTGPGGMFRAMRSIPAVLEVARDIERLCPDAWVLNYINPTTQVGAALNRETNLKVLALCDGVLLPDKKFEMMKRVSLPTEAEPDVTMKVGGINHFSWVTEFSHQQRDLMPDLLRSLKADPEVHANGATVQLLEIFGFYSAVGGHMIEFLPWFQGHGLHPEKSYTCEVFEIAERRKWMKSFNEEIRAQATGDMAIDALIAETRPDLAIRIANSVMDDSGDTHFANFPNNGHISNLPNEAMIELPIRMYADRFEADPFGPMPPLLRTWLLRVIEVQEMTLEAIRTYDRQLLRQALIADPMTVSIEDTDSILADLFEAERDDLPSEWYA